MTCQFTNKTAFYQLLLQTSSHLNRTFVQGIRYFKFHEQKIEWQFTATLVSKILFSLIFDGNAVWQRQSFRLCYTNGVCDTWADQLNGWVYWHYLYTTRSSAIAEGPRDASCQLKSCQLLRNSSETTCSTSTEQIALMKLEGYSGPMCNKHVHSTMTRSSHFHCLISVTNKPTTDELWISPVYRQLAVAKFSKSTMQTLLTWPWPHPLAKSSLITRLRLHMANMCTKFEVSSVSHCGDISQGVKF